MNLDEILERVMDDATLWYIGRITEKEYWATHKTAKSQIKQLMLDIVGEDTHSHSECPANGFTCLCPGWEVSNNKLRAELRSKIEKL